MYLIDKADSIRNRAIIALFTESGLREWLAQYQPNGNIWGLNEWGIVSMLRRLEKATGLPCNAHTFRSTFACLLRKAEVIVGLFLILGLFQKFVAPITILITASLIGGTAGTLRLFGAKGP